MSAPIRKQFLHACTAVSFIQKRCLLTSPPAQKQRPMKSRDILELPSFIKTTTRREETRLDSRQLEGDRTRMAASSSGSGSSISTARASRSAVKKAGTVESADSTPTKKGAGRQKSLAALARSSAAGKHAAKTSTIPPSPSPLNPSLPRPPSWQQSLAAQFDSEHKSPRRKSRKRTSMDERDPGDSVDSTEDEDEGETQLTASQSMLLAASRSIAANNNNTTTANNNSSCTASGDEKQNICVCVR